MQHLEVLATDGIIQKRIIWVSVTSQGVYSDFISEKADRHISYHVDGTAWLTQDGKVRQIMKDTKLSPLTDFKDSYQLFTCGFSQDINKLHTLDYGRKKLDAVVYIDTRSYKSKTHIGCNISLLEPRRNDLLEPIESFASEIHIYTQFTPWIVVTII
jgi:hypothetical protein